MDGVCALTCLTASKSSKYGAAGAMQLQSLKCGDEQTRSRRCIYIKVKSPTLARNGGIQTKDTGKPWTSALSVWSDPKETRAVQELRRWGRSKRPQPPTVHVDGTNPRGESQSTIWIKHNQLMAVQLWRRMYNSRMARKARWRVLKRRCCRGARGPPASRHAFE